MKRRASMMWALAVSMLPLATMAQNARLAADERNTVEVVRQASRGVVHIDARATMKGSFEKHIIESSTGSGFVLDSEGRILTAFHVIKDRNQTAPFAKNRASPKSSSCSSSRSNSSLIRR
jgi:S1-C subfamily serine protease